MLSVLAGTPTMLKFLEIVPLIITYFKLITPVMGIWVYILSESFFEIFKSVPYFTLFVPPQV